ncbi:TlpA family protein disulfide reductase [Alicyclobacillus macrosporangiidus]|uniref:TlpA family protein disulfide reductase n=1 Tax=Alicyclobacillus macrosporangiidus TaxID=392015 RepID=UPI000497798A|nr:hypothetical protein [Alicyclobacillus macrosporangiidus]
MRKGKWIGAALGVVVALLAGGSIGYAIGHHAGASRASSTIPEHAIASSASSQPVAAPTWKGLAQAAPNLESALRDAPLLAANGAVVPFPVDKPVLVFAPWCGHCHETIRLLQQEGLLDRVKLVAAGLAYGGNGEPGSQGTITLDKAKQTVQESFDRLGVHMSADSVLYALPGMAVDKVITGYPEILVPHGGHWYVQPGFVADTKFWHNLLDA